MIPPNSLIYFKAGSFSRGRYVFKNQLFSAIQFCICVNKSCGYTCTRWLCFRNLDSNGFAVPDSGRYYYSRRFLIDYRAGCGGGISGKIFFHRKWLPAGGGYSNRLHPLLLREYHQWLEHNALRECSRQ
jgi:hypothetical protein